MDPLRSQTTGLTKPRPLLNWTELNWTEEDVGSTSWNNHRHKHLPLLPSSIIWYWPNGGDALRHYHHQTLHWLINRVGLTSHQIHYRSYRGRFYGSVDPTNSVKVLKDNSWSVHQVKGQSHQPKPSTRESEVRPIIFFKHLHSTMKSIQRCLEDWELGLTRSNPDTVDQPQRTALIIVLRWNATQYYSIETVLSIFPFPPTVNT